MAKQRSIVDHAPPIVALFVLVAALTGARKNEILSLTWDLFDFTAGTILIGRQHGPEGWQLWHSTNHVRSG